MEPATEQNSYTEQEYEFPPLYLLYKSTRDVIGSAVFTASQSPLSFAVGKNLNGQVIVGDIKKMPHLLIGGTMGSGRMTFLHTLIISLLYKATPEETRLILVDNRTKEFNRYESIPHLLIPVVTDTQKAADTLQWAVSEMMKRYKAFSRVGVRKLDDYNAYAQRSEGVDKIPHIVVVISELADLMSTAPKTVERSIVRLTQMGRAAGIHIIIATKRPSADVATDLIKVNVPSRMAFATSSAMESLAILGVGHVQGMDELEELMNWNGMLFAPLGTDKPLRVQSYCITSGEIAQVVNYVKQNDGPVQYDESVIKEINCNAIEKGENWEDSKYDELFPSAVEAVLETGQASVSILQRRLKLGYARAARLMDQLENKGIVGPYEVNKPRQLLITKGQWQEMEIQQNATKEG